MSELILCNVFIIHENDTFYLQVSFNSSLFFILHFFQKGRKKVKKKIRHFLQQNAFLGLATMQSLNFRYYFEGKFSQNYRISVVCY